MSSMNNGAGDDPKLEKTLGKAFDLSQKLTAVLMSSIVPNDISAMSPDAKANAIVQSFVIGLHAISGALNMVSQITVRDSSEIPTHDHFMFVAVLSALGCSPGRDGKNVCVEFHPGLLLDAMNYVERATGKKLDDVLLKSMARAAREMEAEGAAPLESFMKARKG